MTGGPESILDADVLIDIVGADRNALSLYTKGVGPLCVARSQLEEVAGLDEAGCGALGLTIVDEPLDILVAAGRGGGPAGLSFPDRVILALARLNGWICITNDKRLRRACQTEKVDVRWGLELFLDLVGASCLEADAALGLVRAIQTTNPFITEATVHDFERKLRKRP